MAAHRKQDASGESWRDSGFLGGRMLIAMPGISDPRFERALILMCVHSAQEAMGITVNRTLEGLSRSELFQRLGIAGMTRPESVLVLSGGPVDRERGFVVHSDDYIASDSTLTVADGLRLTATRDILEAMSDDRRRPREAALALGCASWGPGQLEDELRENVWLTCAADPALIFDEDHDSKWARALAKLGVAPERLSAQVGRA